MLDGTFMQSCDAIILIVFVFDFVTWKVVDKTLLLMFSIVLEIDAFGLKFVN